jgi:hypothetical protein
MRKIMLLLSLVLASGLVYAQAPPPDAPVAKAEQPVVKAEKNEQVEAEVVSVDPTANTITFKKDMAAEPTTLPVEGKAATMLKDVQSGQKYKLTCKKDTTGAPKSVVEIKKSTAAKPMAQ